MKAASFEYCRPSSAAEAVAALSQAAGAGKILAGGQSLVPVLAMRLGRPDLLVDVNRIPGLDEITAHDGSVRVGALVRHRDLMDQTVSPLLAEAASWIGHSAIRTRGTCGGSIAHADPSAELPVVAAALNARVRVMGTGGTRTVIAEELFVGPLETSLGDDEMIVAVDFPIPSRWGFAEWARRHGDFGLVTVVVAEVAGVMRLAIGGVGAIPLRPQEAENILAGGPLDRTRIEETAKAAAAAVTATDDIHASARYRVAVSEEMTRRALDLAVGQRGAH